MIEINGVAKHANGPMAGWVIACSNGKQLVGKVQVQASHAPVGCVELSPVFELIAQAQQGPGGAVQINLQAVPILFFGSLERVSVPDGAIVIRADSLSRNEQGRLLSAVNQAAEIQRQLRSADLGISVVPSMPRGLPPMGKAQ